MSDLVSPEDQRRVLANTVASHVNSGWRVESQSDRSAVVVKGAPVNHVLHLILTLVTFGLWAVVWVVLACMGGEQRKVLRVDDYGNVIS